MIIECWIKNGRILCREPRKITAGDIIHIEDKTTGKDKYFKAVVRASRYCDSCFWCPARTQGCTIYHHCSNRIFYSMCDDQSYDIIQINIADILEGL